MEKEFALERQNLQKSTEILKAEHSGLLTRIPQLKELLEYNEMIEANIEKRSKELEVKEKELHNFSLELDKKRRIFEELSAKLDTPTKIQREFELENEQLGQVMGEIARRYIEARQVEDRKREIEGETDRKKNELASILDEIEESGKQFVTVCKQLESGRRLLEMQSLELVSKEKDLESLRESIKLCNSDLELKEKKLESLNNCIAVCGKKIEQQTIERDTIILFIQELSEELVAEENKHKEILEIISTRSSEMEERDKEIKAAEIEASELSLRSGRFRQEVESKEKELSLLKNQIELEEKKLVQLKTEMEEEADRNKKDLVLIISKVEEFDKKLAAVDEIVESQRKRLEIQYTELISKDMELERVAESSKRFEVDIAVKAKKVQALNELITISSKQLDLKSKELVEIQKLIKKKTSEVGVMHKRRRNSMKLLIQGLSEELVVVQKKRQNKATCIKSSEIQSVASDLNVNSQRCWRDAEDREKELEQLKIQIKSGEYELTRLRESIHDCTLELSSRRDQVEAMKNIQRELELKKQMTQMSIKHQKQTALSTETEAVLEDVFMHHENSTFLQRHEVSSVLRGSPNPGKLILELVQKEIRGEVDLHDSLLENWVLLFEELAKIQTRNDPQVQLKAKQVATLWKRKITRMEAPKSSSLEVLAFLLFISAYGLKELISEEDTSLLASSIAQYEHAPTLFDSFGLNVLEMVVELILRRQYIQAVQLICPFKLNIPASDLLMKEIIALKQSGLQKRSPTESSQAKEKDAGRLRAILQLVADYKIELDLPGELVANLVVQRDNSTTHFVANHTPSHQNLM